MVYPVEPELNITLINVGEVPSSIIRVWVNDTFYDVSGVVPAFGTLEIGPFSAPTVEGAEYMVSMDRTRDCGAFIQAGSQRKS